MKPATSVLRPSHPLPFAPRRSVFAAPTCFTSSSIASLPFVRIELERRGHAGAGDRKCLGEREEVVEVSRFARDVDGVDAFGRERGVVHRRRNRMRDGLTDDGVDLSARGEGTEAEFVEEA